MKTPAIASKYINTLPVLFSCVILSLVVYFQQWQAYFAPLILGVIAGGLVDLDNGLTGKLQNLFYTLLAFTISSLAVQLTIEHFVWLTIAFTLLAFIFTFLGAVGTRFRTISFGTLAVAVYTTLTHTPNAPFYLNTVFILLGTLLYSGMALLTHLLFPNRPVQDKVAQAYEQLAHYLNTKAELFDPDEAQHLDKHPLRLAMANSQVNTAFNQVRSTLFYRMRGQHRHLRTARMLRYYFIAQDIHERISSSHVEYHLLAEQMQHSDLIFRINRLLRLQAAAAQQFSKSLRNNVPYNKDNKLIRATQGVAQSWQHYQQIHPEQGDIEPYRIKRLIDNISRVSHQFAHLSNTHTEDIDFKSEQSRLQSPEKMDYKSISGSLKNHFTLQSSIFRHAVRMSVIVLFCCIIIQLIAKLHLENNDLSLGFWILLTAVFVCQPNYSATKTRLKQRIIGTVSGVLLGSVLPLIALDLSHKLAIASIATILFFYFRSNKHSYATFFITIQALMGFSIMGMDVTGFFLPRTLDTLIGTSIAGFATYYLWADWKYTSLEKNTQQAIQANAAYLNAIIEEFKNGITDNVRYRIARLNSHDKAAALSSILSNMSSEADKHGQRLQDGLTLLKLNYTLNSYISALGAYRDKIHNNSFMPQFYTIADQIADLLQNLSHLKSSVFQAAYQNIQNQLDQLYQQTSDHQNANLWQQLKMISELIPNYYQKQQAINQQEHESETNSNTE